MRLAQPLWLLLALAAGAAAWWTARARDKRTPSLPFPALAPLSTLPPSPKALASRWLPLALQAAALFLMAAALARPQKVTSRQRALGRGIDILLALDVSQSMGALDFEPNRLEAAKATAERFVRGRVQDRIGLVAFAGAPQLACPLTLDYEALLSQLREARLGMTGAEGTAVGDGLVSALNHLKGGDAKSQVVVLLTDGRSNTGLVDPVTAARTAAALGVKVYTIGTAKRGPAVLPIDDPVQGRMQVQINDDLDEETLSEVASLTGGRFYRATSLRELRAVYEEIDRLEKSEVKLPDIVSHDDLYRAPALAAAALLLAEAALAGTWLLRWP